LPLAGWARQRLKDSLMANTRLLVTRRKAVRNIRKITRTMELIAAARFKKAFDRATKSEAYTRKIAELAADLSASAIDITHPLLEKREHVKNSLLLVLTSNRGLCGGYNASVLREASKRIQEVKAEDANLHLELSGKRAIAYYRYQRVPAQATYTQFEDKVRFEEVNELAKRYLADFIAHKLDRIEVAYVRFVSSSRQTPIVETLLPLTEVPTAEVEKPAARVEYEFLPSAAGILEEILPMSFKVRLFKCFLDAAVSEQLARRVAMSSATENADEMIKTLTRYYNRARQANITKEIMEVVGGAAALE
jgi:F-type H+-transporting ATPase subunit gamma